MANYTNMVKSNHDRSEAMLNLSLTTISEMVEGKAPSAKKLFNKFITIKLFIKSPQI